MIRHDIGDPGAVPNNTTPQYFATNLPGGVGRLVVQNDTPYAVDITTNDGVWRVASGVARLIPVYTVCALATWAVVASLMPADALYSDLLIEAYGPDEPVDEQYPVNIIRQQASSSTVIANELGTTSDGLTISVPTAGSGTGTDTVYPYANGATTPTRDVALDVLQAGALVEALRLLGADASTQIDKYLAILGNNGSIGPLAIGLLVTAGASFAAGKLVLDSNGFLNTIGNQLTTGFGVPAVVRGPTHVTAITSTALQTLATFTAPTDGLYRLSMTILLSNGTSGNLIKAGADYTDADTGAAANLRLLAQSPSSTAVLLAGGTSIANGRVHCAPGLFYVKGGSTINIVYQDPTNTPNDTVEFMLERLS